MPTDPVYNPHLPSSASTGSSSGPSSSYWSRSPVSASSSASESCTSWSSLPAGLCTGAVAGAALALIFAPARGSQVRASLRSYASQGGERLSQIVESGRCMAEDALHQASALIEEGRRAFRTSADASSSASSSSSASLSSSYSTSQPLTASVAEISGASRRFEEPLGG